ncbi:MAG: hypothetical protein ACD_29C00107G0004 [uncultured bacterium]|nr:MAG: hypothetical protein ACD_29C00107G0004 [uncultured bacterium]
MKKYFEIDPENKNCIKRNGERPALRKKDNAALQKDYNDKNGVNTSSFEGLSRNHRLSDDNIKNNIINDVNSFFSKKSIASLIKIFPWKPDDVDKKDAELLLENLQKTRDISKTVEIASQLYYLMSVHPGNISYGNARQNSAIGKNLDLNAPKNTENQHSLTPRSRTIAEGIAQNKNILYSPPKIKDPKIEDDSKKILSSHYGSSSCEHKEDKNIDLGSTTPRTGSLMKRLIAPFF